MRESKRARLDATEASARRRGPTSLRELFAWPRTVCEILDEKDDHKKLFLENFTQKGVTLGTFYSGMLTPEVGLAFMAEAVAERNAQPKLAKAWACDYGVGPQIVMRHTVHQEQCRHCYSDLNDFLSRDARERLDAFERSPPTPASAQVDSDALYESMAALLFEMEKEGTLFSLECEAQCLRHLTSCGMCSWSDPDAEDDGDFEDETLKVAIAGSTCTGWSSVGLRKRRGDQSMRPFLIFVFLVRCLRPDILIHECTVLFDVELLREYLGNEYQVQSMVMSPQMFGFPHQRNRRYTVLIRAATMAFAGTMSEFQEDFRATMELDGDVLFAADGWGLLNEVQPLQTRRQMVQSTIDDVESLDWRSLYNPGVLQRLADYSAARPQRQDAHLVDLAQNVGQHTVGRDVPCLLTSAMIYSFAKRRHMTPEELLCAQGMPAVPAAAQDFQLPWATALADERLSKSSKKLLAGNGMHIQCVTALTCYVLSRAKKVVQNVVLHNKLLHGKQEIDFDSQS